MVLLLIYRFSSDSVRRVWAAVLCALTLSLVLSGCGPTKQESWNSYYYGTHRSSSVYPQDNDDTYVAPTQGAWNDNQTPQGMKWK